ncbi:MAG: sensor histidine kinase [Deltaproteobacteria bacterium]|nr:MAG: sensor histidine kinase [Deltaproteobacteria bacterium]
MEKNSPRGNESSGTPSLWHLHAAIVAATATLVASWCILVPQWFDTPPALSGRLRSYPLILLSPALAVFLLFNHFFLRPLVDNFAQLRAGSCPRRIIEVLARRAVRHPFRVFVGSMVVVTVMAALVGITQAPRKGTPLPLVVQLFGMAVTHGIALATLLFGIHRFWLKPFLSPAVVVQVHAETPPDLFTRLALCLAVPPSMAWTGLGAFLLHRQVEPVADGSNQAGMTHILLKLGYGWALSLALALFVAAVLARQLRKRIDSITQNLTGLFSLGEQTMVLLPPTSADELGELSSEMNRLAERLAEHINTVRQSAIEASRAERRQLGFMASINHDLRTPLHSIIGFAELLEENPELTESQKEDAAVIRRSAHHLLGIIDDIVDLSQLESVEPHLDLGAQDLAKVASEAVEAVCGRQTEPEVTLEIERLVVRADRSRLRQILINLVSNAVKYASGSPIRIRASRNGDFAEVAVEDSGPGIPAEYMGRIFHEFERAGSGDMTGGTGLGLAITRRLVELHGGTIRASNRPEGGACFCFTIPLWGEEREDGR